jgi:secreted protein
MKQTDIIKNIENWFRTAVPSPGIFDQNVQASCIIEETMEFVSHLGYDNDKTPLYSLKNQLRSGATRI